MECDLSRLHIAIKARREADDRDLRNRIRLAGGQVEEPLDDPKTDEEFNERARQTLAMFRKAAR